MLFTKISAGRFADQKGENVALALLALSILHRSPNSYLSHKRGFETVNAYFGELHPWEGDTWLLLGS
jgi:hypothetical protein